MIRVVLYASGSALSGTQQAMGAFSGQSGSAIAPFLLGTTVLTLPSYVGGEHLSWEEASATLEPGVGTTATPVSPAPALRETDPPTVPAAVTIDDRGELECSLPVTHSSTDGSLSLLEVGVGLTLEEAIKRMTDIVCQPHITKADANAQIQPILAGIIDWVLQDPVNHINFLHQNYRKEPLINNRILEKTVTSQYLKVLFNQYIAHRWGLGKTSAAEKKLYSYLSKRVSTPDFRRISHQIVHQTLRAMYKNTARSRDDAAIYQEIQDKVEGFFARYKDGDNGGMDEDEAAAAAAAAGTVESDEDEEEDASDDGLDEDDEEGTGAVAASSMLPAPSPAAGAGASVAVAVPAAGVADRDEDEEEVGPLTSADFGEINVVIEDYLKEKHGYELDNTRDILWLVYCLSPERHPQITSYLESYPTVNPEYAEKIRALIGVWQSNISPEQCKLGNQPLVEGHVGTDQPLGRSTCAAHYKGEAIASGSYTPVDPDASRPLPAVTNLDPRLFQQTSLEKAEQVKLYWAQSLGFFYGGKWFKEHPIHNIINQCFKGYVKGQIKTKPN
ncbi:MAG: hypothetical protein Q8Q56_05855, partial [Alphaproteobacteria bacterium]|nr:hypothetical protein [Alphaproteobacteria bacterium]